MNRLFHVGGNARGRKVRAEDVPPGTEESVSKVRTAPFLRPFRPFLGLWSLLRLCVYLATILNASRATGQEPKIAAEWKNHFKSKPVIEECVFERVHVADNSAVTFYEAKWQQNAFLIRQVGSLEEIASNHLAMTPGICAGHYGSNYWAIDAGAVLKLFLNYDNLTTHPTNGDEALVFAASSILSSALNYGMGLLDPATLEWEAESKFTALAVTGDRISGQVLAASNGLPTLLEWHFENSANSKYTLEYTYGQDFDLDYYPSKIQLYMGKGGSKQLFVEFKIHKLKTSSSSLAQELFNPKRYFLSSPLIPVSTIVFSNGVMFSEVGGQLERVRPILSPTATNVGHLTTNTAVWVTRLFVLAFIVLSAVVLIVLAMRQARHGKHTQNNERNEQ